MSRTLEELYGTSEPPPPSTSVRLGPLSFETSDRGLRDLRWRGVELVRAIDYPIRDENWGTLALRVGEEETRSDGRAFEWTRSFETEDGSVRGRLEVAASSKGDLTADLVLEMLTDRQFCRTGFTLLHPIRGLAGRPMWLRSADDREIQSAFPDAIAPAQPASGFVAISYAIHGASVSIETGGVAFEMEDQRNWSDASFKSYVMTGSFPGPYGVKRGEVARLTLTFRFSGGGGAAATAAGSATLEGVLGRVGRALS